MDTLHSKSPNFIRCVKPNSEKVANHFDSVMVLHQLKYAGLFEAIRVRASGYAYRKPHSSFYARYRVLLSKANRAKQDAVKNAKLQAQSILDEVKDIIKIDNIQIGKTKVFYRNEAMLELEELRSQKMLRFCVLLQALIRKLLAKKRAKKLKVSCASSFLSLRRKS